VWQRQKLPGRALPKPCFHIDLPNRIILARILIQLGKSHARNVGVQKDCDFSRSIILPEEFAHATLAGREPLHQFLISATGGSPKGSKPRPAEAGTTNGWERVAKNSKFRGSLGSAACAQDHGPFRAGRGASQGAFAAFALPSSG
jgi:hypothetical protein